MSSVKLPRDTPHKKRARYHSSVIDADEINYKELSDRVRQFKETEEGVNDMCDISDEMRNEAVEKDRIENAKKMINDGSLSLEKIAEFSGLSIEKVRELAGNKSA